MVQIWAATATGSPSSMAPMSMQRRTKAGIWAYTELISDSAAGWPSTVTSRPIGRVMDGEVIPNISRYRCG
nr:hypothetical protein [Mycolicibacterium boenickei]